jgi:hypothetical protein
MAGWRRRGWVGTATTTMARLEELGEGDRVGKFGGFFPLYSENTEG